MYNAPQPWTHFDRSPIQFKNVRALKTATHAYKVIVVQRGALPTSYWAGPRGSRVLRNYCRLSPLSPWARGPAPFS